MNTKEVINILDITNPTLHKWVEEGRLHPARDPKSGRWVFDRVEVLTLKETFTPITCPWKKCRHSWVRKQPGLPTRCAKCKRRI